MKTETQIEIIDTITELKAETIHNRAALLAALESTAPDADILLEIRCNIMADKLKEIRVQENLLSVADGVAADIVDLLSEKKDR